MKVTTQDLSQLGASQTTGAQASHSHGTGESQKGQGLFLNDSVQFSSTLGSLSRAMGSDSSARQAKVQALAAQYQSGNYKPSSAAITQGILAEAMG